MAYFGAAHSEPLHLHVGEWWEVEGGHRELENLPGQSVSLQLQLPFVRHKNTILPAFQGKPKINNSIYHLPILNVIHKFLFFFFNTVAKPDIWPMGYYFQPYI